MRHGIQFDTLCVAVARDFPFAITRRHDRCVCAGRRCPQCLDIAFHAGFKRCPVDEGFGLNCHDESAKQARGLDIFAHHRGDVEAEPHAGKHGTEDFRDTGKAGTLEAEGVTQWGEHFGQMRVRGVDAGFVRRDALGQPCPSAAIKQDTIEGDGAGRHVEEPRIFAGNRDGHRNRVGAVEARGAIVQANETVGIAEGQADHSVSCCLDRIGACRAEMRIVANTDGADAEFAGEIDRPRHRGIGRDRALGVVAVQRFHRTETGDFADVRVLVQATAFESLDVMGKQADAVAVHAAARGVHEGPRGRVSRRIVGTASSQDLTAKAVEIRKRYCLMGGVHGISSKLLSFVYTRHSCLRM
ncbi:hypothetical protein D3C73_464170 [compost metagenome]